VATFDCVSYHKLQLHPQAASSHRLPEQTDEPGPAAFAQDTGLRYPECTYTLKESPTGSRGMYPYLIQGEPGEAMQILPRPDTRHWIRSANSCGLFEMGGFHVSPQIEIAWISETSSVGYVTRSVPAIFSSFYPPEFLPRLNNAPFLL
jgi:hypothetical protein